MRVPCVMASMLWLGCGAPSQAVEPMPEIEPCARLAEVTPASSALEERIRDSVDVECEPSADGAWGLAIEGLREEVGPVDPSAVDGEGPLRTIRGTWTLLHAARDGSLARGAPRPLERIEQADFGATSAVEVVGRFDYDGDGHEELLFWVGRRASEEEPRGGVEVWSYQASRVVPYAPAAAAASIDEVRDVDGDGRPDLVSRAPYFGSSPWAASSTPAGGPEHVFHSRPDGTFSDHDDVALSRVVEACAAAPTGLVPPTAGEEGYDAGLFAVSCARLRGESADAIVLRLHAETAGCADEGWSTCAALVAELERHARELVPVPAHQQALSVAAPTTRRGGDGRCDPTPREGAPCSAADGYCVLDWGSPGGSSSALWCRDGQWQLEREVNL